MKQVAALPYEFDADGHLRVMLITSRRTRRWVIPKGNPIKGIKAHEAAAQEAFEEAGLLGVASKQSIGTFRYHKQLGAETRAEVEVTVFPLRVSGEAKKWPERRQRERRWLDPVSASKLADDVGLKRLILAFDPEQSA